MSYKYVTVNISLDKMAICIRFLEKKNPPYVIFNKVTKIT